MSSQARRVIAPVNFQVSVNMRFAEFHVSAHTAHGREATVKGPDCSGSLACIVTYEPDRDDLAELIQELLAVIGLRVVLIDNSESEAAIRKVRSIAQCAGIPAVSNCENRGIAHAHNQAVKLATSLGCVRLLLFDQDSYITTTSVERLHMALDELLAKGKKVAAVGALLVDRQDGHQAPFVRLSGIFRMTRVVHGSNQEVKCDLVISSGSLFSVSAFSEIGLFDEQLFIDYVDIEWCVRARSLGFEVFGVPAAEMSHSIGNGVLHILGRRLPVHSPARQYYLVRNALLFARKPYLPVRWRLHLLFRAAAQFTIFSCFCAPRLERVRWLGLGLWHGIRGQSGPR